jgi:hypothetical protein
VICCDTCPYYPACEEIDDFKRDVLLMSEEAIADEIGWGAVPE